MRHDPAMLAARVREQAKTIQDRETAALLRGMAEDLENLAGNFAALRHAAGRTRFSGFRRRIPRSAARS